MEHSEPRVVERSPVPKPVVAFFAVLRKVMGKAEEKREVIHEPDGVSHHGTWTLQICIEADELDGGFVAECLDVPGAVAQGETEEEAVENLIDAVQGVFAVKMEEHFRNVDFDIPPSRTAGRGTGRRVSISF